MRILREADEGRSVLDIFLEHNISEQTFFHRWKRKYGNMEISDAKRLKELEKENRRLKTMMADQALQIEVLKEVKSKNGKSVAQKASREACGRERHVFPATGLPVSRPVPLPVFTVNQRLRRRAKKAF